MTAGNQVTLEQLNARAAALVIALRDDLAAAVNFRTWLAAQTDTTMLGLGYVAPDLVVLRGAFDDLHELFTIAYGQASLPAVKDFTANGSQLYGGL